MSIRCPKPDCGETFATDKARKKHCDELEDHDYCKKCDYLAKDWDDLTHHKVTSPIVHLCCGFCGMDFKTTSGLQLHIKQLHPVDQDIRCVGCNRHFIRGSALIEHLELGRCPEVSTQQFSFSVQYGRMFAKILNKPDAMSWALFHVGARSIDAPESDPDSTWSTALLDEDNQEAAPDFLGIWKPLEPVLQPLSPIAACVSSLDTASGFQSSPLSVASLAFAPNNHMEPQALSASSNSLEHALNDLELEHTKLMNPDYLFMQRYWDREYYEYDPERFYNPIIELYECPYPDCASAHVEPYLLAAHIKKAHRHHQPQCPHCQKRFHTTFAAVAHCEDPNSKCGVSHSARYAETINMISGGFLSKYEDHSPSAFLSTGGYSTHTTRYSSAVPEYCFKRRFVNNSPNAGPWDKDGRESNFYGSVSASVLPFKSSKQHQLAECAEPQLFKNPRERQTSSTTSATLVEDGSPSALYIEGDAAVEPEQLGYVSGPQFGSRFCEKRYEQIVWTQSWKGQPASVHGICGASNVSGEGSDPFTSLLPLLFVR